MADGAGPLDIAVELPGAQPLNSFSTAEITQLAATLIAIYGLLMTPIGWSFALIVWGYALVSFLINDQIKVWLFRKIQPYS